MYIYINTHIMIILILTVVKEELRVGVHDY